MSDPFNLSTHDTVIKVLPRLLCGPNGPGSSQPFFIRSWPCHAEPSSSAAVVLAKRRRSSAVPSVRPRPSQPHAASSAQHQAPQVRARRVQRCSRSSFCFSEKEQAPIKEPPITKPFPAQVKKSGPRSGGGDDWRGLLLKAAAITRSPNAAVFRTSSLSTNLASLQLAVGFPSHSLIAVTPGGSRSPRSSVLVRVPHSPTGVGAVAEATVQLEAPVAAAGDMGARNITAGAARPLGARSVMTLAGPSNVEVPPFAPPLAFILTTSPCPSRGTMQLCARLFRPTAHPPTLPMLQSPLPRAKDLWKLLPLSAASR